MGRLTKCSRELPHVRSQGQRPRVPGCDGTRKVRRSYPASEVSGSREELPSVRGQWRPEETSHVRGQGRSGKATSCPRAGEVTLRSQPEPEARGSSWEEPPTPEARASGREEHPEEQWLCRQRRAKGSYPTLKVRKGGDN